MSKTLKAIKKIAEEPKFLEFESLYNSPESKEESMDEFLFESLPESEELPIEYTPCPQCGFDHSTESEQAAKEHEKIESGFWDQYFPTKSAQYSGWSPKKSPTTTPMPSADIQMKSKPSHIDLPPMPKAKSREQIVEQIIETTEELLKELKKLDEE